jgi:hypothetical protein
MMRIRSRVLTKSESHRSHPDKLRYVLRQQPWIGSAGELPLERLPPNARGDRDRSDAAHSTSVDIRRVVGIKQQPRLAVADEVQHVPASRSGRQATIRLT